MARRERLNLNGGMTVETSKDGSGRFYVVYARGISVFMRNPKEVRKWLALPLKTASREAFDSWIASIKAMDAERKGAKTEPLTSEEPIQQTSPSLSQELLATGFGPEVFAGDLDESDPNYACKTII